MAGQFQHIQALIVPPAARAGEGLESLLNKSGAGSIFGEKSLLAGEIESRKLVPAPCLDFFNRLPIASWTFVPVRQGSRRRSMVSLVESAFS